MAKKRSKKTKSPATKEQTAPTRRDVLKLGRNVVLGTAALGGVGFWGVGSFRAYAAEHDLTRVGQGAPVIVQVHDPQCPTCTALQKQTRAAMAKFDDCGLIYLVADIKTEEGAAFAARFGVPHVTLLLLDGQGALRNTVSGMHNSAQLEPIISAHKGATQA